MPTLHWIGKDKVINHHMDVPFRVLEHSYGFDNGTQSETETKSGNKIIHGDNLEALKSLLPEYEGKIKCIYIDPPYNTGNENWVYNDNVNYPKIKKWLGQVVGKEAEDLTRHDKWLCMMYPRLKLLHKLLSDDGAIFISIDDNEQANLKLICDEIFGRNNFVSEIIVENDSRARPYNSVAITHEYLMFYKKSDKFIANILYNPEKNFSNKDCLGGFDLYELRNRNSDFNIDNRPNLYYPFWVNPDNKDENDLYELSLTEKDGWIKFYPQESKGIKTVWRWGKEKALKNLNINIFGKKSNIGFWQVVKKYREDSYSLNSVWTSSEFKSDRGTLTLKSFFENKRIFSFPKSYELIQQCLILSSDKNSIILDSFSGSGTSAHAVLNLNKRDGGNRKFILIEMEDYSNTITAERVKRVINGYSSIEGTGGSFDFYELGQPLFNDDGNLHESVGVEKIRNYIFYTETKKPLVESKHKDNKYFLNKYNDTAYYFNYEADKVTTLNHDFLSAIKTKAEQYVIYADKCLLTKEFMTKKNIIFKKIPRDITRF